MTTIAFKDNKMAADTLVSGDYGTSRSGYRKLWQHAEKIYGACGNLYHVENYKQFIKGASQYHDEHDFVINNKNFSALCWDGSSLFYIYPCPKYFKLDWNLFLKIIPYPTISIKWGIREEKVEENYAAIGSGAEYAYEKLIEGYSLEEALEYAGKNDKGTNTELDVGDLIEGIKRIVGMPFDPFRVNIRSIFTCTEASDSTEYHRIFESHSYTGSSSDLNYNYHNFMDNAYTLTDTSQVNYDNYQQIICNIDGKIYSIKHIH